MKNLLLIDYEIILFLASVILRADYLEATLHGDNRDEKLKMLRTKIVSLGVTIHWSRVPTSNRVVVFK